MAEPDIDRVLAALLDGAPPSGRTTIDESALAGGPQLFEGGETDPTRLFFHPAAAGGPDFRYAPAAPRTQEPTGLAPAQRQAMQRALTACFAEILPRLAPEHCPHMPGAGRIPWRLAGAHKRRGWRWAEYSASYRHASAILLSDLASVFDSTFLTVYQREMKRAGDDYPGKPAPDRQ
ncbi:hypothetical protein ACL2XP_00475 [Sodalis sp. RH21]|uniref:hypothetical protein n=1 Tax=unclassified Sodalis (in: enterobacteria) TaxID=2636512 RepID=UPI0039B6213C